MKNLFHISLIVLLILSCSKENEDKNSLIGQWQLVEECLSDGESWGCTDVENGYTIEFNKNETFSFNESNPNCLTGSFFIQLK